MLYLVCGDFCVEGFYLFLDVGHQADKGVHCLHHVKVLLAQRFCESTMTGVVVIHFVKKM